MIGLRGLARTLLAGTFVVGGLRAWNRSSALAERADSVTAPVRSRAGRSVDTEQVVQVTAAVQIVGGALFALGVWPRLLALVLGASLVPTAVSDHAFWEAGDDEERARRQTLFLNDAGLLGGLLFVALDTGGRPSVFWSGRRAARGMADTVSTTTHSIADRLPI
jgi:uncharacterized membrane protein YphA (DoxX/SURF4 family)